MGIATFYNHVNKDRQGNEKERKNSPRFHCTVGRTRNPLICFKSLLFLLLLLLLLSCVLPLLCVVQLPPSLDQRLQDTFTAFQLWSSYVAVRE